MSVTKWALLRILNIVIGMWSGCERIWSWHEFLMVWCQITLSLHNSHVRWVVYRIFVVWLWGVVMSMACCTVWMLSASLCSPHAHRVSCILVIILPFPFVACHVSGRLARRNLRWEFTASSKASTRYGTNYWSLLWGEMCAWFVWKFGGVLFVSLSHLVGVAVLCLFCMYL